MSDRAVPVGAERSSAMPWPPLLLLGTIGLGLALDRLVPLPLFDEWIARAAGGLLAATAVLLDAAAIITLVSHRTTVLPHRGSRALVTSGPFALSRNPIYLGNILLTVGLAFLLANAWLLPAAAVNAVLVHRLAIAPEERHLEARFGNAWRAYRARTPRWLSFGRSSS